MIAEGSPWKALRFSWKLSADGSGKRWKLLNPINHIRTHPTAIASTRMPRLSGAFAVESGGWDFCVGLTDASTVGGIASRRLPHSGQNLAAPEFAGEVISFLHRLQ